MHDLASLIEHLHLLLGVTIVGKHVDLRDYVVSKLICELLDSNRLVVEHLTVLGLELLHCHSTCTTGCLI